MKWGKGGEWCAIAVVSAGLFGCGPQKPCAQQETGTLPRDLQKLQGSWVTLSTNTWSMFDVVFSDYTVRLKGRKGTDGVLLKRNACIMSIDEQNKRLLMHNEAEKWSYDLRGSGGEERLGLGFYSHEGGDWGYVEMKRKP